MKDNSTDGAMCFVCDYGWITIVFLVVVAIAYFTKEMWLPLLGVTV